MAPVLVHRRMVEVDIETHLEAVEWLEPRPL
jgi:hypothetical protein